MGCHFLLQGIFPTQGSNPGLLQCKQTLLPSESPGKSHIGAPQCIRQILTSVKGEINSNTIIVGDFNTPLTPMDKSTKQKFSKETQSLNDTMDQLDLIDIYRIFHPKTMNFIFFSSDKEHSRIDHILGHKSSFGKFKKKKLNHFKHLF